MHPQGEIKFAGVVVLGTSGLLTKLRGKPTTEMHALGGAIKTWQDADVTWACASLKTMPPWNFKQLRKPADIERLKVEDFSRIEHTMAWAWIDEAEGLIRARTFAKDWEIPEAQGNGSGAMLLSARLGRKIEIRHGKGAIIFAQPAPHGCADIGGRVNEEAPKSVSD